MNISGATGPETAYYLDGVDIGNPRFGATSSNLPYSFVRELQVKTGGCEAEFGRSTGGIVDVITYSGGNQFGGQVFGFFTDDALTAEPKLAAENARESAFSEYDVGGSLGGPIVRDRLWFFAAYDPNFHRQQVQVPGLALPDDRTTEHLFASKITWQADASTDVMVSAQGDPLRHHAIDLSLLRDSLADVNAVKYVERFDGLVLSTLIRRRLGKATQAEIGVTRLTRDADLEDATGRTDPHYSDETNGVVSGGYGTTIRSHNLRAGARASLAFAVGRHAAKAGVEYEDNRTRQLIDASAEPASPEGFITRVSDSVYRWERYRFGGVVHNRVVTLYAQDSWRLGARFVLNAGVRWDAQYLLAEDRLVQRFTDEWQPRVGFVFQPGVPGTQKAFGSYGRFYEQIPLQPAVLIYNPAHFVTTRYHHDPRLDPGGADTVFEGTLSASDFPPGRDLRGQSLDEFTLGYERAFGHLRVGLRRLNWALEDGFVSDTLEPELGNPGRGHLASAPRARRTYHALALTVENSSAGRLTFRASYVLSRSRGNYEGLSFEGNGFLPNLTPAFDTPEFYPRSTGLLPNDRPHVFKLSGAYRFAFGFTIGTAIEWSSGAPRNEFGVTTRGDPGVFLVPRGSAGRTDALFDANLRLAYTLRPWRPNLRPKVYLDLFHLGNRRTVLDYNDLHYLEVDAGGVPVTPNPLHGRPLLFQPPMSARIGMSVDFGQLE